MLFLYFVVVLWVGLWFFGLGFSVPLRKNSKHGFPLFILGKSEDGRKDWWVQLALQNKCLVATDRTLADTHLNGCIVCSKSLLSRKAISKYHFKYFRKILNQSPCGFSVSFSWKDKKRKGNHYHLEIEESKWVKW